MRKFKFLVKTNCSFWLFYSIFCSNLKVNLLYQGTKHFPKTNFSNLHEINDIMETFFLIQTEFIRLYVVPRHL